MDEEDYRQQLEHMQANDPDTPIESKGGNRMKTEDLLRLMNREGNNKEDETYCFIMHTHITIPEGTHNIAARLLGVALETAVRFGDMECTGVSFHVGVAKPDSDPDPTDLDIHLPQTEDEVAAWLAGLFLGGLN